MRCSEHNVKWSVVTILFFERRDNHAYSSCSKELLHHRETGVNVKKVTETVCLVDLEELSDSSVDQVLVDNDLHGTWIFVFGLRSEIGLQFLKELLMQVLGFNKLHADWGELILNEFISELDLVCSECGEI